jgi:D-amino peptidase
MKDNNENMLIIADMEGTMGLADMKLQNGNSEEWAVYGRKLLTREVNAAAAGAIAGGAKRVFLCDAHNSGRNIDDKHLMAMINKLPAHSCNSNMHTKEVTQAIYKENHIGAVVLVGYHPMASNKTGFAPHSVDSNRNKKIQVNSKEVGEIALISALAGYFNVPVVAITGDKEAVNEAKTIIPQIQGVATKEKLENGSIALKNLDDCELNIVKAVKKGFEQRSGIKPFIFSSPVKFVYELHKTKHLNKLKLPKGVHKEKLRLTWQETEYLTAWDKFWTIYMGLMFLEL